MESSVEAHGEVEILTVNGAIHAEDNDAFAGALDDFRKRGRYRLVIDGEALDYINSRAVGTLVAFSRDARIGGGKVVILRPSTTVSKILKSVGLLSLMPSFDKLEDAVAACGG
jgi:anti-anti-sigma factor